MSVTEQGHETFNIGDVSRDVVKDLKVRGQGQGLSTFHNNSAIPDVT